MERIIRGKQMSDNKNRIIVIQKDEENKTKGPHLSWAIYGKGINHFKWWIIGGTAVFAILGFLGSKFFYNSKNDVITTTITPSLALNDSKETYLDGTVYKQNDIISRQNIEAILEDNPSFKYTYDSLMENNVFSISPTEISEIVNGVTTTKMTYETYILSTKPGAFKSEKETREFIKLLVNYEIERSKTAATSFSFATALPSKDSFQVLSFDKMVESLNAQFEYLSKDYAKMVKNYGASYIVDGSTLSSCASEFTYQYSGYQFRTLSGQLSSNKYVNISSKDEARKTILEYKDLKSTYETRFATIASTLNSDLSLFNNLVSLNSGKDSISESLSNQIESLSSEIKALQEEQAQMITELTQIGYVCTKDSNNNVTITNSTDDNNYLYKLNEYINDPDEETDWSRSCVAFKNILTTFYDNLAKDTDRASSLYRMIAVNSNRNTIDVKESNMGTLSGHIPNPVSAIACAILGFGILSLSFAIAEMNLSYNRALKEKSMEITASTDDSKKEEKN